MSLKLFIFLFGIFLVTQAKQPTDQENEDNSVLWTKVLFKKLNTLLDYNSQLSQRLNQQETFFKAIVNDLKCGKEDLSGYHNDEHRSLQNPNENPIVSRNWTVIQRRQNVSKNFNRSWLDYTWGFGYPNGDFFIGLEKLHEMTTKVPHELRIELKHDKHNIHYANYDHFVIGSESEQYELKELGKFNGAFGDFIGSHIGRKFSTFDRDNDGNLFTNCANMQLSGWWFDDCSDCNLNAKTEEGIYCYRRVLLNKNYFETSLMMIREK